MSSFWNRQRKATPSKNSRGFTASGMVIDLQDRNVISTLSATKMAWQSIAWNYRDNIGELGAALRLKANIISKVKFVAAAVSTGDDEPRRLTGDPEDDADEDGHPVLDQHVIDAAVDCLTSLPFEQGYGFQGMISQGFDIAGECWLHGSEDADGDEQWNVRSTSEIIPSTGGLGVIEIPGKAARPINTDTEALIRLWVPHPQWSGLADSPMRLMMDVCEDVILIGRELRAAARSRIAANGIVLVPNELSFSKTAEPDAAEPETDTFQADLTAGMTSPINNEGDAGAIVPMVLRGDAEDLKEFRHVTFERATSPELLAKQQAALMRIADGINLPSEMMGTGDSGSSMSSVNHWTGWLIDASTFKNYIEPDVRMICDSLTMSYFRRKLRLPEAQGGYGLTKDEALSVQIWYDAGNVTENANRSADADAAMDQGAISFKAYRDAKGFSDEDAPDEDDLRQMQMLKSSGNPDIMGQLGALLLGLKEPEQTPQIIQGQSIRQDQPSRIGPGAAPGTVPSQPVPPLPARVASGAPEPTIVTAEVLAEIDRALRERLRQAGDDAVLRAVEKAGNRIKAKAANHSSMAVLVKGADAMTVGEALGQARIAELGLAEDALLAAAFAILSTQFAKWTAGAIKSAIKAAAKLVPIPLTTQSTLAQSLTSRIPSAWKRFEGSLTKRALDKMYGRQGDELRGEVPDTLVLPGDVREALTEIGGGDSMGGGLATGDDIVRVISHQAEPLGFTWRYGITDRVRAFEPHLHLAGKRFAGFEDPALKPPPGYEWVGLFMQPGDHNGCMCDYVMAWAVDEATELAAADVATETESMRNEQMLADLDDAAGRTGTTAQRTRDQRDAMVAVQENWIKRKRLT